MRVLNVDDDEDFNYLLSRTLSKYKIGLTSTQSSEDFFCEFKNINPDICLVDNNINVPGEGEVIVKAIRSKVGRKVPIIMVSSNNSRNQIDRMISFGADDFISKPLDEYFLINKLNFVFNKDSSEKSIQFPQQYSACKIETEFDLVEVNERGCILESDNFILGGTVVNIRSTVFDDMGFLNGIRFTVVNSTKVSNGYRSYLEFCELGSGDFRRIIEYTSKRLLLEIA